MNDRDLLYSMFEQANEQRKRKNFNAFMDFFEEGLIKDLDNAYASGDMNKYNELLNNIKSDGTKVFRNSAGKHKIKFI